MVTFGKTLISSICALGALFSRSQRAFQRYQLLNERNEVRISAE